MKISRRIRRSWLRIIPQWMKCFSTLKAKLKKQKVKIYSCVANGIKRGNSEFKILNSKFHNVLRSHTKEWAAALFAAGLIVSPYTVERPEELSSINFHQSTAYAMPSDGQVIGGQGQIQQTNAVQMDIQQQSVRVAIDWQSFDVAKNETVNFHQPSADAVALNRILGNNASEIYGHLNANGQVYLSNPNGILFARGSEVNVSGLIATTSHVDPQAFMQGGTIATNERNAAINAQGSIFASGGLVEIKGATAINVGGAICASKLSGDGGSIIISSADKLDVSGASLLANGSGAGNGGVIETSGD